MTRVLRHPQTSFTGGEIAPDLYGRIDMSRYLAGMKRGLNVRVRLQGGVKRRGGTRHRATLDDGTDGLRFISFAFNTSQTYAVVCTAGRFRVFNRNGALVASGTGAPWTIAQLPTLNWAQSADTLLLFNPDIQPRRLRRGTLESDWTLSLVPLDNLPTFNYGAVEPTGTVTPSAVSGKGITLTASDPIFTAAMVGWHFIGNGGRVRITAFTDSTHVTGDVLSNFRTGSGSGSAKEETQDGFGMRKIPKRRQQAEEEFESLDPIDLWLLEEPVISATRGWPACGDFHLGRLWLGGLKSRPSTLLASVVGEYFDFDQGTALDDESIYVTIDARQVNAIHQIVSGRTLQVFTAGAEFAEMGGDIITPRTVILKPQSTWGTDPGVRTTDVEGATLFAQKGGRALRQFVYGDIEQAWASDLISLLSGHLIKTPVQIETIVGDAGTDGTNVLITNTDGTVTLLTVARDQQIVAFTPWETNGEVKGTACLQSGDVFWAVERDGSVRIEQYDPDALLDASVLVESATEFDELTNLFHLAGMEVGIILDNAWQGTGNVDANGYLALPRACTRAEVGLVFDLEVEPMPIEPRDPTGAMIGRKCRVVELALRLHETASFEVNGQPMVTRQVGIGPASPLDAAPRQVSDDVVIRGMAGWAYRHTVSIRQPIPGPFQLLALNSKIQLGAL